MHDGGIVPAYSWTANAGLSGDGTCIEFAYNAQQSRIGYNDLSCTAHRRRYICEYVLN